MVERSKFDRARAVADAVLLEGYALYPYRASSKKNQLRWQFGVLAPRAWSEAGGGEPWWMETQCLVETPERTRIEGRLRFLRVRRRRIEVPGAGESRSFAEVESLEVDGALLLPWDEGELLELDFAHELNPEGAPDRLVPFSFAGDEEIESVQGAADGPVTGGLAARVVRRRLPLAGVVRIATDPLPGARPLVRLRVRVENLTGGLEPRASRDHALSMSLLSAHLLLSQSEDRFVSLFDPPAWATAAAAACKNVRTYPVLACEAGQRNLVLSSPIILYDHPAVAPESPGDLFDATEIDEILTLRTLLLTDDEKRQARATDQRVAALIDRVDGASPETLERLHGAIRQLRTIDGGPLGEPAAAPAMRLGDHVIAAGSRVRLQPGARRTDAQDLFLVGRIGVVEKVMRDVDDRQCLAVLVEDDPAAELHRWYGRYLYFYPDEIEPLAPAEAPGAKISQE